jgi:hypothetical protein
MYGGGKVWSPFIPEWELAPVEREYLAQQVQEYAPSGFEDFEKEVRRFYPDTAGRVAPGAAAGKRAGMTPAYRDALAQLAQTGEVRPETWPRLTALEHRQIALELVTPAYREALAELAQTGNVRQGTMSKLTRQEQWQISLDFKRLWAAYHDIEDIKSAALAGLAERGTVSPTTWGKLERAAQGQTGLVSWELERLRETLNRLEGVRSRIRGAAVDEMSRSGRVSPEKWAALTPAERRQVTVLAKRNADYKARHPGTRNSDDIQ